MSERPDKELRFHMEELEEEREARAIVQRLYETKGEELKEMSAEVGGLRRGHAALQDVADRYKEERDAFHAAFLDAERKEASLLAICEERFQSMTEQYKRADELRALLEKFYGEDVLHEWAKESGVGNVERARRAAMLSDASIAINQTSVPPDAVGGKPPQGALLAGTDHGQVLAVGEPCAGAWLADFFGEIIWTCRCKAIHPDDCITETANDHAS